MLHKLEGAVLKLEGAAQKNLEKFLKVCPAQLMLHKLEGAVTKHTTEKSYKFGAQQFAAGPNWGAVGV